MFKPISDYASKYIDSGVFFFSFMIEKFMESSFRVNLVLSIGIHKELT